MLGWLQQGDKQGARGATEGVPCLPLPYFTGCLALLWVVTACSGPASEGTSQLSVVLVSSATTAPCRLLAKWCAMLKCKLDGLHSLRFQVFVFLMRVGRLFILQVHQTKPQRWCSMHVC